MSSCERLQNRLGQLLSAGMLFKDHAHAPPDGGRPAFLADDVGHHPEAFVEVDQSQHEWYVSVESAIGGAMHDRERVNGPFLRGAMPAEIVRLADGADPAGIKLHMAAVIAALVQQLIAVAGLPVFRRIGSRQRRGLMHHGLIHQCTRPRMREQCADRIPPSPWTSASSASSTCRGPARCFNWLTASTT